MRPSIVSAFVSVSCATSSALAQSAPCEPQWHHAAEGGPAARAAGAAAFDEARGVMVYFGGVTSANDQGDTWTWDGGEWTLAATTGPAPRRGAAMAYDAARQEVVLFGGYAEFGGYFGDTWTWDGSTWSQESPAHTPSARSYGAAAFDSAAGKVILFGGNQGGSMDSSTWAWDGSDWTEVATSGPEPRTYTAMAYDSSRSRVVLFGGGTDLGTTHYTNTWEWDGISWMQVASDGPPARDFLAMAYDSDRERVLIFGGSLYTQNGSGMSDTWEWDGSTWSKVLTAEPFVFGASGAFDSWRHELVIFGGHHHDESRADTTWTLGCYAGSCEADCERDGDLDVFDFLCYQSRFAAGCP